MKNLKMMRKRKLKIYFKIGILFVGILLSLTNCERDNLHEDDIQSENQEPTFTLKQYSRKNIEKNTKLVSKLKEFSDKVIENKSAKYSGKNVYNKEYDFTIYTDSATYIQNGDYHSYTFRIVQGADEKITNVLFELNDQNDYNAYLVKYDYTSNELNSLDFNSLSMKTSMKPINLDFNSLFSKTASADVCIYSYEYRKTGVHFTDGPSNLLIEEWSWVLTANYCETVLYEDEDYTNYNYSNNTATVTISGTTYGGTGGSTTSPMPSPYDGEELIKINAVKEELNLHLPQRQWIDQNGWAAFKLYNFLSLEMWNEEAEIFAKEAINIHMNLDDFDELIKSPIYNPLDNPWLKQIRGYAERVFKLKDKLSDELWENLNRRIDDLFISALTKTALEINPNADTDKDANKDYEFKNNGKNGVGILLYEFANGLGPDERDFYFSEHDFAKQFLSGNVPNDIKSDFLDELNNKGLTFEQFITQGNTLDGGYSFSPDHTNATDSFNKHINANWVQFFIGGTNAKYSPSSETGWIEVILENPTSRNSLLLHQTESYPRDTYGNIPLSTIKQYFHFKLKIQ